MIGSALVDLAESRFGDSDNAVYTAAEWLEYVNAAYMDVITDDPNWPFLETRTTSLVVAAGTGTVALPADTWRVTAVFNATDKIPLAPIPGQAQFNHYFPDPENGLGIPLYYRLLANSLEVYPFPAVDTTLHVDHPSPPAALLTSTEPIFAEHYHRILVLGALAHAHEDDENLQQAQNYRGRYERMLAAMKHDLLSTRFEGYPEIIDVF